MSKTFEERVMTSVVRTETDIFGVIRGYDESGNHIYSKHDNYEEWFEYYQNSKPLHYKRSDGFENFRRC